MKYVVNINQPKLIEFGININQGAILDLLCTSPTWAEPEIVDNEVFYWVSRKVISEQLKAFSLKEDTVYRHFKALQEKGLIIYKKVGKKDCIQLTEKGKTYMGSPYKSTSYKDDSQDKEPEDIKPESKDSRLVDSKDKRGFNSFIKLLKEVFKSNKISTFSSKLSKTKDTKEAYKRLKEEQKVDNEVLAKEYAQYVKRNRNLAVRLNKWLWAKIEDSVDEIEYSKNNGVKKSSKSSLNLNYTDKDYDINEW